MTSLFIDVSEHDWVRRGRSLDWTQIAAAGLADVMCARASYGDPQTFNPPSLHFGPYMVAAKRAGYTCRGGYHNLIHSPDQAGINRQVDLLRRALDMYGTEWALCDVEAYPELLANGLAPQWADVQRFHDRWYAVEGRVMGWYIAHWVWEQRLGQHDLSGLRGPLFAASYPGGTGTPKQIYAASGGDLGVGHAIYGNKVPAVWQFTATATVPGASSQTDCSAFRGTRDQLLALLLGPTDGEDDMDPQVQHDLVWRTQGIAAGDNPIVIPALAGGLPERSIPNKIVEQLNTQAVAITALAQAIAAIGTNSPEVAGILAQVQAALDTQTAALGKAMTDTVAALGEGGAAEVRRHAPGGAA